MLSVVFSCKFEADIRCVLDDQTRQIQPQLIDTDCLRPQPLYKLYSQSIFQMKSGGSSNNHLKINDQRLRPSKNPLKNSIILQQQCNESEEEFTYIIERIQQSAFFKSRSRHTKIKLDSWMEILLRDQYNSVWKSNKMNYLKLLSLMCQCERLVSPFTAFPKHNTLPLLQKHEVDRIIDEVQKEVRSSKFTTKRKNDPATDSTKTKNSHSAKDQSAKGDNCSKSFDGKENVRNKKNKEKEIQGQFKGDVMTRKKERFQVKNQPQTLSAFSPQKDMKINRGKQSKPQFARSSKNTVNSINFPTFQRDFQQDNHEMLSSQENSRYFGRSPAHHKYKNSISESVSLELSPVSVSSKVWQFTHKKGSKRQMMNHTFDISKMARNTVELSKHPRLSNPLRLLGPAEDQYSTGEALKGPQKQYWESNTYTGNATPKYLNSFNQIGNVSFAESENYDSFRAEEKECCSWYCPL